MMFFHHTKGKPSCRLLTYKHLLREAQPHGEGAASLHPVSPAQESGLTLTHWPRTEGHTRSNQVGQTQLLEVWGRDWDSLFTSISDGARKANTAAKNIFSFYSWRLESFSSGSPGNDHELHRDRWARCNAWGHTAKPYPLVFTKCPDSIKTPSLLYN